MTTTKKVHKLVSMEEKDCDFCNLERVSFAQVPKCIILSFVGVYDDFITKRRDFLSSLTFNDRILYIIGVATTFFAIRLLR